MAVTNNDVLHKAILDVLSANGECMSSSTIGKALSDEGIIDTSRPHLAVIQAVCKHIACNEDSPFYKADDGKFGLRAWVSEEEFNDCRQKLISSYKRGNDKIRKALSKPKTTLDKTAFLRKCPSYKTLVKSIPNGKAFIADLNDKIELYLSNSKTCFASCTSGSELFVHSALVAPLLQLLGYSVFSPNEVMPDCFYPDTNRAIDYTVFNTDGTIKMLILCTAAKEDIRNVSDDILSVVAVAKSVPVIITNGTRYVIYLDGTIISLVDIFTTNDILIFLTALHKATFNPSLLVEYSLIPKVEGSLKACFSNPTDELVGMLLRHLSLPVTEQTRKIAMDYIKQLSSSKIK